MSTQKTVEAFGKEYLVTWDDAGNADDCSVRRAFGSGESRTESWRTIWKRGGQQKLGPTAIGVIEKARQFGRPFPRD